jgi:hypothetical protein
VGSDYIHVPRLVFDALWTKHNSALTFYMALSSLVTVEIPDPEFSGQKLGVVLGGTELRDSDLAERLERSPDTIKHGRLELQEVGLLVKRQYQHTYKLALRQSEKWTSKNQGQMGPRYRWITEAQVSAKPLPEFAEESVKPTPRSVNPILAGNLPIPDGNLPIPLGLGPMNPKDLREGKQSLNTRREQREKVKPGKINPSLPLSSDSEKIAGQVNDIQVWMLGLTPPLKFVPGSKDKLTESTRSIVARRLREGAPAKDIRLAIEKVIPLDFSPNPSFEVRDNLDAGIDRILADRNEARRTEEMVRQATIREQAIAATEQAEFARRKQEELELVEEELPDESARVCATG